MFCADGLPCPMQLRRLAQTKAALRMLQQISPGSISRPAVTHAIVPSSQRVPAPARAQLIPRSQEDHMTATQSAQRSATSIASAARDKTQAVTEAVPDPRAGRICGTPGCKHVLALNNTSGFCGECRERQGRSHSKKTNGHGLQLTRRQGAEVAAPEPAKPNGADHREPADVNGNREKATESHVGPVHVESRVDLLLAAIPSADKAKMLCAWLMGSPV